VHVAVGLKRESQTDATSRTEANHLHEHINVDVVVDVVVHVLLAVVLECGSLLPPSLGEACFAHPQLKEL
jgi:hypothetical protein